jgi:hypothetical protein
MKRCPVQQSAAPDRFSESIFKERPELVWDFRNGQR